MRVGGVGDERRDGSKAPGTTVRCRCGAVIAALATGERPHAWRDPAGEPRRSTCGSCGRTVRYRVTREGQGA